MKKRTIIILLIVIALLIGGGIVVWKWNKKEGTKNSDSSPTKKPLSQLSDEELEKCLLDNFSRRLELKKYFVFNLGELKTKQQRDTGWANMREMKNELSRDLNKLAYDCEKELIKKGHKIDPNYTKLTKKHISFMGENFTNYDKEEWWEEKIDDKISNWKDKFIIFEKDDEPEKVFFKEIHYHYPDKPSEILWVYSNVIYLRMNTPTTKICKSKSETLDFLKKNDPALTEK